MKHLPYVLFAVLVSSCASPDFCRIDTKLLEQARELHSPEMNAAIAAAQSGVPRK